MKRRFFHSSWGSGFVLTFLSFLSSLLSLGLGACSTDRPPGAEPQSPDPSLRTLDRLLAKKDHNTQDKTGASTVSTCLAQVETQGLCPFLPRGEERTFSIRLALDPRYVTHWPNFRQRLQQTMVCVNRLYHSTGISWQIASLVPWEPGKNRHNLFALLHQLQSDYPPDLKSIALGITVWDERRIYASSGGEIGLSQRAACVVPSWPRVENDCLILAHELGHLLGARHVPGKQWIMSWAAHPFHLPTADPISRVIAMYRFHPRNKEAIQIYQRAYFTPEGLALPPDCSRRLELLDKCWQ